MKIRELIENQNLNEVGDNPTPHEPRGKRVLSDFVTKIGEHTVRVWFYKTFTGGVQILYSVDGNLESPSNHKYPKENPASKDVVKILSTVKNVIEERLPKYIKRYSPVSISFSGKGSRINFYTKRAVPFISDLLGPKWHHNTFNVGTDMKAFVWNRVQGDENLSEASRVELMVVRGSNWRYTAEKNQSL